MAAPRSTRKIQLGAETTAGTLVAATYIWRGLGIGLKDERKVERIPEDIGLLPPTSRSATYFLAGSLSMPSQVATFEGLPYIFAASIKSVVTGVADGGGAGKVYAYPEPVAATKNAIQTYTIEAGDGHAAEVGEFGFVEEWELSGAKDGAVMLNAKWRTRQVAAQAFTGSLVAVTPEAILFNKSRLYVDATSGTLGATQKTKTFTRFSLKKSGGWKPIPTSGDGQLYFGDIDYTDPKYLLDLTFLHDATSVAAKAVWRAETGALIRMNFIGSTLTTAGTYTTKTLNLDLAGKWTEFDVIGEQDGFQVCTGKLEGMLDTAAALHFNATVVNQITALT